MHAVTVLVLQRRKLRLWDIRYLPQATQPASVELRFRLMSFGSKGKNFFNKSQKHKSQGENDHCDPSKVISFWLSEHKTETHHTLGDEICNTYN